MTVVIELDTGKSYRLDRGYSIAEVATRVDVNRGKGLVSFDDNRTPCRTIYIDPDHVVAIQDDGRAY